MCIWSISNIKLTVTYTVPPPGNPDDPTKPQAKHLCHQHPFMSANTHSHPNARMIEGSAGHLSAKG